MSAFTAKLRRLWRWTATSLAALAILAALAVGVVRITLPLVPAYRIEVEQAASAAVGLPVHVGSLGARWLLGGPEIVLEDVWLEDPATGGRLVRLREIRLVLDLWQLVNGGGVTPSRVLVVGGQLEVTRDASGGLTINGVDPRTLRPSAQRSDGSRIEGEFQDMAIVWRDLGRDEGPWSVVDLDASFLATANSFQAEGEARVQDGLGRRLVLVVEAERGDAGWAHRSYAEVTGVDLARIAERRLPAGMRLDRGQLDLEFWTEGVAERLDHIGANIDLRDLSFTVGDEGRTMRQLVHESVAARIDWVRAGEGWRLDVEDLVMVGDHDADDSTTGDLSVERTFLGGSEDATYIVHADRILLQDMTPLVGIVPDLEIAEAWVARAPRGRVEELSMQVTPGGSGLPVFSVRGRVDRLGIDPVDGAPGFDGLDMVVAVTNNEGQLGLDSARLIYRSPGMFREPLVLETFLASMALSREADGLRIVSQGFTLSNDHISARGTVDLLIPAEGAPVIDLRATAGEVDLAAKSPYLPVGAMSPTLVGWLDRAVVDGTATDVEIELRGQLDRYPFVDGDGRFAIRFDADDIRLDYAEGWPVGEGLGGEVLFEGNSMHAEFDRGSVAGVQVEAIAGGFESLGAGLLELDIQTRGDLSQYLELVAATPVGAGFRPYLQQVEGAGESITRLRLELPTSDVESTRVDGALVLDGATLELTTLDTRIEDLVGSLGFSESRISAEAIRGRLFGWPARIEVGPAAEAGNTELTITGSADELVFSELSGIDLSTYLAGDMDWTAVVVFPNEPREDGTPAGVVLRSALSGMAITLPAPLDKAETEAWPSELRLQVRESGGLSLDGSLGDRLALQLALSSEDGELGIVAGDLRFGGGEAAAPERGLVISGRTERLPVDGWLQRTDNDGPGIRFDRLDLDVGHLQVWGQRFDEARLSVVPGETSWAVTVAGPGAEGSISVPVDDQGALLLDMERLHLTVPETQRDVTQDEVDPRTLPPVRAEIAELRLGPALIGRFSGELIPVSEGLLFRNLLATTAHHSIKGEGGWYAESGEHRTELELEIVSTDVGPSLVDLGWESSLEADDGVATMSLRWPAPPYGEVLTQLSGTAALRLDHGQIRAVKPGAGRLFGLLSLNALPRRLLLDFSDFFNEGLAFDRVTGTYTIEAGDAYTQNLLLKGPAADIGIVGRTGLAAQDYEQDAVVSASFGSSLPLAGTLAAGPGLGAALLVFTRLFKDELKEASRVAYRITGSWDDPRIEKLGVLPEDARDPGREGEGEGGED